MIVDFCWTAEGIIDGWDREERLERLPAIGAIYALSLVPAPGDPEQIVYIGRTKNLRSRAMNHNYDKPFNFVYYLQGDDADQRYIENQAIFDIQPPLNLAIPARRR